MCFSTHLSIMSEHLALDTQRGLLSKWSTPQPHAMPTSFPSYASNGETDDTQPSVAFLSLSSSISLWMKGDEFSQMEHPLFPLEAEEMRPGGGFQRPANHNFTLTLSITSSAGQSTGRREASETADAALISVWIMMGEWVTERLHRFASVRLAEEENVLEQYASKLPLFFKNSLTVPRQNKVNWCRSIFVFTVSTFRICLHECIFYNL